ncbi:DUF485 domain-containing protein [Streptomyces sp. NPDC003717]|uniref:DUF485 domain-containing protein n=1 Tax=Streptomyces sp. NPDC003717 TaxID=3154276 RepID=UPI0033B77848
MQSSNEHRAGAESGPDGAVGERAGAPGDVAEAPAHPGYDDPWYDALAAGWGEPAPGRPRPEKAPTVPASREPSPREPRRADADVYTQVQRSAAFQEVRSRYRGFVLPATAGFLLWYVAYVVAATTAPGLMARPVTGAVNVAMVAGLGQFLTTFLLTWAYARHARLRRDRAALQLRWDTQELARGARGGAA